MLMCFLFFVSSFVVVTRPASKIFEPGLLPMGSVTRERKSEGERRGRRERERECVCVREKKSTKRKKRRGKRVCMGVWLCYRECVSGRKRERER